MSLSAVSASLVTIANPRFSPHLAFTASSRKISFSSSRARLISSIRDLAEMTCAPLHRTTELSALSLVATYTTCCPAPGSATHGASSSSSSSSRRRRLAAFSAAVARPESASLARRNTSSTDESPRSSANDARSIHESASFVTLKMTQTPAFVRDVVGPVLTALSRQTRRGRGSPCARRGCRARRRGVVGPSPDRRRGRHP